MIGRGRYTKRFRARARLLKLSPTMLVALLQLQYSREPVWYHDLGAGAHTAEALLKRRLVEETRAPGKHQSAWHAAQARMCTTHHGRHAGYLQLTRAGRLAIKDSRRY